MKKLSQQEMEIIKYSASGYSVKEIAKFMDLHPSTIKTHILSLREKLKAKNKTHAVSIAYEKKLIEVP